MRVCLLYPNLDQGFSSVGFVNNSLEDLEAFEVLIALEAHLLAILLEAASGDHCEDGLAAPFREQALSVRGLRLSVDGSRVLKGLLA